MKEANKIKLTQLATILETTYGNNAFNGETGFAIIKASSLREIGKQIMDIVHDEMIHETVP